MMCKSFFESSKVNMNFSILWWWCIFWSQWSEKIWSGLVHLDELRAGLEGFNINDVFVWYLVNLFKPLPDPIIA